MTSQAENSVRKKKRKKKNILLRILVIAALLLFAAKLVTLVREPVRTEVVYYGTLEDSINTNGYLLRNEYVVTSPADGMLSCIAGEGERVNKSSKIATVFEGKVDEGLQSRLASINERINEQSRSEIKGNLVVGDAAQVDAVMAKTIEDVIVAAYSGDMSKIPQYKNDLSKVILQRMKERGEAVPKVSKMDELLAEKKRLEEEAGNGRLDVYAPVAGVFSSKIDGFEDYFDLSNRSSITPDVIAGADNVKAQENRKASKGGKVVKIIDNYEWYYAAAVDPKWIKDLKVGSYVKLRFPDISGKSLDANIDSISQEKDGKVTLVISCNQYDSDIYALRRVNADIIRSTYSGFKVPKSAVRMQGDKGSGVYILKDGIPKYRQIEILHTGEDYVVAREDNKAKDALLLYDEVIVSGSGIEDVGNLQ